MAVRLADGWVRSPVDGLVTSVSRTRHAIGVTSDEGVDVLVHVGIDTVLLGGAGFEAAVSTGDRVSAGQVEVAAQGTIGAGHPLLSVRGPAHR